MQKNYLTRNPGDVSPVAGAHDNICSNSPHLCTVCRWCGLKSGLTCCMAALYFFISSSTSSSFSSILLWSSFFSRPSTEHFSSTLTERTRPTVIQAIIDTKHSEKYQPITDRNHRKNNISRWVISNMPKFTEIHGLSYRSLWKYLPCY